MRQFKVVQVEHTEVELIVTAEDEAAVRRRDWLESDSETVGAVAPTELLSIVEVGSPAAAIPRPPRLPSLYIPEEAWDECGPEGDDGEPADRRAELTCSVVVNGVTFYADAYAVVRTDRGLEAHPDFEGDLDRIYAAAHAEGSFDTVEIAGREHVVILTPHT